MTMTSPPQTENETFSGFVAHRLHISSGQRQGSFLLSSAKINSCRGTTSNFMENGFSITSTYPFTWYVKLRHWPAQPLWPALQLRWRTWETGGEATGRERPTLPNTEQSCATHLEREDKKIFFCFSSFLSSFQLCSFAFKTLGLKSKSYLILS